VLNRICLLDTQIYSKILDIRIESSDQHSYRCEMACMRKDIHRIDIFDILNVDSTLRSIVFNQNLG